MAFRSLQRFVCVFALFHIKIAGAVRFSLPRFDQLLPAKLTQKRLLSEMKQFADEAETYIEQEEAGVKSSTKSKTALRVQRKDTPGSALLEVSSSHKHVVHPAKVATRSAKITTVSGIQINDNSMSVNLFQADMMEEHVAGAEAQALDDGGFTMSDWTDMFDPVSTRLTSLFGLTRFQGSPAVKVALACSTVLALYMLSLVIIRSFAERRAAKKFAAEQLAELADPGPDLGMFSANLEEKKFLEKMLREDLGLHEKMLREDLEEPLR